MSVHSYQEDQVFELTAPDGNRTVRIWQANTTDVLILGIHGGMSHSGDMKRLAAISDSMA